MANLYGWVILTQRNNLSLLGIYRALDRLGVLVSPLCVILSNIAGSRYPN